MSKKVKDQDNNSKSRSKFTMCFACCMSQKNNQKAQNDYDNGEYRRYNKNERYEYVVEKLAIKKVPFHMIATQEDIEETGSVWSNSSIVSTNSSSKEKAFKIRDEEVEIENMEQVGDAPHEKASIITFASYYSAVPKTDIDKRSSAPRKESSVISLNEIDIKPSKKVVNEPKIKHKIVNTEKETEMVSHILNQCSSIYTLDSKNVIPKDPRPLNPIKHKQTLVVPPHIQKRLAAINKNTIVQAHIHHEDFTPLHPNKDTQPESLPVMSLTKELPPDLRETITALGTLHPCSPRKNYRRKANVIKQEQEEKELCNLVTCSPDRETKQTKIQPNNMSCQQIYKREDTHCACNKKSVTESEDEIVCGNPILSMPSSSVPIYYVPESKSPFLNTAPGPDIDQTSSNSLQEEIVSTESQQITEISQLKGQNLKWKIIIKHHSDKDGPEQDDSTNKCSDQNIVPKR